MNADERTERIKDIARQLITRVRDDEPAAVWRWLRLSMAELAGADPLDDWVALAVVQACATPDDRTWRELVAWTGEGQEELTAERFGTIPWRERYARPRPRPQPVDSGRGRVA